MERSTEQRVLAAMRKLLARIVREVTPEPGMRHPLSAKTVKDIRAAFELISSRERELLAERGARAGERPRYADQPRTTHAVAPPAPARPRTDS